MKNVDISLTPIEALIVYDALRAYKEIPEKKREDLLVCSDVQEKIIEGVKI